METSGFTPQIPPKKKQGKKIAIISILSIISILLLFFLGFFVYYSLQFKYGNVSELIKIDQELKNSQFTFSSITGKKSTETKSDINEYVRPHNPTIGNEDAKITILAFVDFECPFCQASYVTFQQMAQKYGSAVKIVFKHMPLSDIHPKAVEAALAATCAHDQAKFWPYYNTLFQKKTLDKDSLDEHAVSVDLDITKFQHCLRSNKFVNEIEQDMQDGIDLGVRGTPTYFINQSIVEGVVTLDNWDSIILKNLKK